MNQTNQLKRTMTRILLAFMLILTGYAGVFAQAVDFTQAANKLRTSTGQVSWIGSILNDSKSDYYEGMAVPQRIILTGLAPNQEHTFYFSFSSIKANTHSYDFITSWDKAISVANFVGNKLTPGSSLLSDLISEQCGEAIPSNYVAVCTNATNSARVTIPSPPNPSTNPNGSNIAAIKAAFEGAFSGDAGLLLKSTQDISGAKMTFEGYSGADMDGTYKLVWNSGTATTAVIQFAGHLALGTEPSLDWAGIGHGDNFGAGAVSGAPYHINLGRIDGSSLGNQDNQISAPLILGCVKPTATAGVDQTICQGNTVTLAGNFGGGASSGIWRTSGSGTFSNASSKTAVYTPSIADIAAGSVTLTFTTDVVGTCGSATDEMIVTINALPTTANAGDNQTQCDNGSFTLAGNAPTVGTGVWSIVSGSATITTPSSATSTVTGVVAGSSVTLRWTISNGVCTSSTDDVVLQSDAKPTDANAGADQTQCDNGSFTLAGNAPTVGTGVWSIEGAANSAVITTPSSNVSGVTSLTAGNSVTLRWTISNGVCTSSTDDVVLKSDAKPTTANAGADQTQCDNGSFTLAGNAPTVGTGVWSIVGAANGATITDANSATSGVSGLTAGSSVTLSWTISNGVCTSSTDDVVLQSDAKPTDANAGADQSQCDNGSFTLAGNVPTVGTGVWTIVGTANSAVITTPSSNVSGVTGLTAGSSVTLLWTISNGVCTSSTDDVVFTNKALPTFTLTPTASPCLGAPEGSILVTSTSGTGFEVKLGAGGYMLAAGTTYTFNNLFGSSSPYSVTVKQNGCSATNTVTVNDGTVVCYPYYTYSQGYYGNTNGNGVACIRGEGGLRTRTFIQGSLENGGGTLRLGNVNVANNKYFAVPNNTAAIDKLLLIMPGGGSPNALSAYSILPLVPSAQLKNGKINTVLLGQAVAMWFNINIPGNELGSFDLKGLKCKTTIVTKEASSASSCNRPYAGTSEVSTAFPQSVVTAMMANSGKTTVKDLVDFASEMLGQSGKTLRGVSFADMNSALDAIVNAFHGGKYFARFDGTIAGCTPPQPATSKINVTSPVEDASAVKVETSNAGVSVMAFPNPYIDQVTFNVTVKNAGKGSLVIYNILGQKVANVFEGNMQANSTQTIRYNVPFAQRKNLVYVFRQNDITNTGKLVSGK